MREQANLPGTVDQHPNWRRKLPLALERWPDDARFVDLVRHACASGARPRTAPRPSPRDALKRSARIPRATYRLQLHRDFTFARRDATRALSRRAGRQPRLLLAVPARARRAARTATTSSITRRSIPRSARATISSASSAALRAPRHGADPRHRAQPHGRAWAPTTRGGWTCSRTAPASSVSPTTSTSTGSRPIRDLAGKVLRAGAGRPLRHRARARRAQLALRRRRRRVRGAATTSIACRSIRATIRALLGTRARGDRRARSRQRRAPTVASLVGAFGDLPPRDSGTPAQRRAHAARKRRRSRPGSRGSPLEHPRSPTRSSRTLRQLNGTPGDAAQLRRTARAARAQAYRLAYWRVASDEINYRRFFDINDLAALRMENEAVFDATHRLVLARCCSGKVDGLRIDHPDGLYDPAAYFQRLQKRYAEACREQRRDGRSPALRRGREDRGAARAPARDWRGARHDRLPLRQPGERPLRRHRGARARRPRMRAFVGERAVDFDDAAYARQARRSCAARCCRAS